MIYKNQSEVENILINRNYFDKINLGYGGVIVSSIGNKSDFVSRFFTPQATILEDTLLEKTEEFDEALDPDPSQTPSLLTRRRMEKLVEVIEGKSANAEGVSLEI